MKKIAILVILLFFMLGGFYKTSAQLGTQAGSVIELFLRDFSMGYVYPDKINAISLWVNTNDVNNTKLIMEGCKEVIFDIHEEYFKYDSRVAFSTWNINPNDPRFAVLLVMQALPYIPYPPVELNATLAHDGFSTDGHTVWEWQYRAPITCDNDMQPKVLPSRDDSRDPEFEEILQGINEFLEEDYKLRHTTRPVEPPTGDIDVLPEMEPAVDTEIAVTDVTSAIAGAGAPIIFSAILLLGVFFLFVRLRRA